MHLNFVQSFYMAVNTDQYKQIVETLKRKNVTLIAVSKTKPVEDIQELYGLGQRDFGENYVQELTEKQHVLPNDIRWHFIGHLQGNKVKCIAPFVHLIHGVDSFKLLQEINKQAEKNKRIIHCLMQIHIAQEETKFGMNEEELAATLHQLKMFELQYVKVVGLMGMASFSEDNNKIRTEFRHLRSLYNKYADANTQHQFSILSMGMSGDYTIAIEEGSTMVRIGSLLFGDRNYNQS